jgi:hypothetical protein
MSGAWLCLQLPQLLLLLLLLLNQRCTYDSTPGVQMVSHQTCRKLMHYCIIGPSLRSERNALPR